MTHDAEVKSYEVHPGIGADVAGLTGLPQGASYHFVLNNIVVKDNRIPPQGFTNAAFATFGGAPVDCNYVDGQFWDVTNYSIPPATASVQVTLYYQSTSKEFIEFLRDENRTNTLGQEMYDLWNDNGKCPPTVMAQVQIASDYSPADFDKDFDIDVNDCNIFAAAWLSINGEPAWNAVCDISEPFDRIDMQDFAAFSAEWQ